MYDYKIYGESYIPEDDCTGCEDKDKQIKEMKMWINYLLEEMYSRNPISEMHRYMEELCHVAEIDFPAITPTLARLPKQSYAEPVSEVDMICNEWININNQYLNNIKQ